ncbi:MAG: prepilin peptidase [Planctomycetes bacterium]|nr:prepilin peptidase [Planctomycetota bacterium]
MIDDASTNINTLQSVLSTAQGLLLIGFVFLCAGTDAFRRKVFNTPCLIAVVAGLALSYMRGGMWAGGYDEVSLGSSFLSMSVAFTIFIIFYMVRGLGAGDVKLIAGVGALAASLKFILWTVTCTAFAGVPIAIGTLIIKGDFKGGLFRSIKSLMIWKYKRPDVATTDSGESKEPSAAGVEEAVNEKSGEKVEAVEQAPKQITVPYATAVCLGVILTFWLYIRKNATGELPVFF